MSFIPKKELIQIENEIKQTNWRDTVENKSCEQACNEIMSALKDIIARYTETKTRKPRAKHRLLWFNSNLWQLIKKRDASLKRFLKSGLITDHLIYKSLRNKVIMQLRKAKASFFLEIIREAKGNSKQLWKTIDKLTGKDNPKYESI